jgi:L-arabinose isomerase
MGTVGQLAALKPDIADKIDMDQVVDDYAEFYGVNPKIIVPDDKVAEIRAQRAQQLAEQQAAASVPEAANAAKTMGDVNLQGVQDVMQGLMGYGTVNGALV